MHAILCGVGGQGTVLASKLLARAAMDQGLPAHTAETIGMAQRGGCVVSHVRVGEGAFAPLIPRSCADALIGFEPAEAVRALPFVRPGGLLVVSTRPVAPFTVALSGQRYAADDMLNYLRAQPYKLVAVDPAPLLSRTGSLKALNVLLLGAAAANGLPLITLERLENALRGMLPPKLIDMNLTALRLGANSPSSMEETHHAND
ncbi:MAG: indolepyruvate oxidoreductase subunit beta [Oscillospiraceae bacterium]|jgi:indolepyruvate ferredoxin oxidoreductase beta subunit|nr:indolepyruvate oxidoreductase subunit beta [Oscillospiraceae bacterium]